MNVPAIGTPKQGYFSAAEMDQLAWGFGFPGIDGPPIDLAALRGAAAHPFSRWVKQARGWEPGWNFNKVLVGRDGRVAGTFGASDAPAGTRLTAAIATALAAGS